MVSIRCTRGPTSPASPVMLAVSPARVGYEKHDSSSSARQTKNTHTQTNINMQTRKDTNTQSQRHANTQTNKQTRAHTHTPTNADIQTHAFLSFAVFEGTSKGTNLQHAPNFWKQPYYEGRPSFRICLWSIWEEPEGSGNKD